MNPVFFSKKIPAVQKVLSSSSLKSSIQLSKEKLDFRKIGSLQESNQRGLSPHFKQALVICDGKFRTSALLKKWRENKQLRFYYVRSGEQAKGLEQLPQHIQKITSLISDFDKRSVLLIAIGGGSLIDLAGFLASIYKRGLPIVFIPSTWLSALDSAHGGKNALNFKSVKNLLGTYHFPKAVFIVEELLKQNPKALEQQAYGELLKMAFIKGGSFYKNLQQSFLNFKTINCLRDSRYSRRDLKSFKAPYSRKNHHFSHVSPFSHIKQKFSSNESLQKKDQNSNRTDIQKIFSIQQFLQIAIESKIEIVKKDPFETKEERKKLNLGHTVGHILEAVESLPHGLAVLRGLLFSLNWSYHKGFLNKKNFEEMKGLIPLKEITKKIPFNLFKRYLRQDKKHKAGFKIDFIFIKKPGEVFGQPVLEKDLIQEAKRQSLL